MAGNPRGPRRRPSALRLYARVSSGLAGLAAVAEVCRGSFPASTGACERHRSRTRAFPAHSRPRAQPVARAGTRRHRRPFSRRPSRPGSGGAQAAVRTTAIRKLAAVLGTDSSGLATRVRVRWEETHEGAPRATRALGGPGWDRRLAVCLCPRAVRVIRASSPVTAESLRVPSSRAGGRCSGSGATI